MYYTTFYCVLVYTYRFISVQIFANSYKVFWTMSNIKNKLCRIHLKISNASTLFTLKSSKIFLYTFRINRLIDLFIIIFLDRFFLLHFIDAHMNRKTRIVQISYKDMKKIKRGVQKNVMEWGRLGKLVIELTLPRRRKSTKKAYF